MTLKLNTKIQKLKTEKLSLVLMLRELYDHAEYCGWVDNWESEGAYSNNLPERAEQLLARLE